SRGGALTKKNAESHRSRAGLLQGFDFAHAHHSGEFVAFADNRFGRTGTAGHRTANDIGSYFFEIRFEMKITSFDCALCHKIFWGRPGNSPAKTCAMLSADSCPC